MKPIRIAALVLFATATVAAANAARADEKKPAPPAAAPAAAKPAAGAPAAAPPAPAPSKELEAFMKGFEGSWKCETKFAAGSMGPGSAEMTTKSNVKIKKDYGGFSWHGEFSIAKTKTMPGMSGIFQIGFDSGSNQATVVSYDSMGGAYLGAGPIAGDAVSFSEEAYMMGMKSKLKETMTKKGPKEIDHSLAIETPKGLQPVVDDTCKK